MSRPRTGPDAGAAGLKNMFSGEHIWAKLAASPKTRSLLNDPAMVNKIKLLQSNPQMLAQFMGDPQMMSVISVMLGIDMMGGGGGPGGEDADMPFAAAGAKPAGAAAASGSQAASATTEVYGSDSDDEEKEKAAPAPKPAAAKAAPKPAPVELSPEEKEAADKRAQV